MDDRAQELTADLEAAIVRALRREWDIVNYAHFRRALKPPLLLLSHSEGRLGCFIPQTRIIEISRSLVLGQPWGVVMEVLKHEMAHQYVYEVLGARDERAHGEAFRRTCERLGLDPAASGLPRAPAPDDTEARLPRRIAKLLALAESPNRHEAEAAMREAHRLMLKYNVDSSAASQAGERRYGFRHLGEPTGRLPPHQRQLGAIISTFFFVEAIWVTVHRPREGISGTVLEVCGTAENLEMASYVYDFLLATAERLWREHKRTQGIASDRDRRSYLTGVMRGFYEKLEVQERETRREGLVWVKDARLSEYYDRRHPHRHSVHSRARAAPAAYAHGKAAGQQIVLHKPVGGAGGRAGGGRLLPSGRS